MGGAIEIFAVRVFTILFDGFMVLFVRGVYRWWQVGPVGPVGEVRHSFGHAVVSGFFAGFLERARGALRDSPVLSVLVAGPTVWRRVHDLGDGRRRGYDPRTRKTVP